MRKLVAALALVGGLTACSNACQDICKELAAYAEECDSSVTVSDEQLATCKADFKRSETDKETRQHCAEFADNVRDEWTCDEALQYMGLGESDNSGGGNGDETEE